MQADIEYLDSLLAKRSKPATFSSTQASSDQQKSSVEDKTRLHEIQYRVTYADGGFPKVSQDNVERKTNGFKDEKARRTEEETKSRTIGHYVVGKSTL